MNLLVSPPRPARPAPWAIPLAFTLVYLAWGTTYLALRWGVRDFPAGLFGGARIGLAGLVLMAYLAWRGERLRLSRRDLLWAGILGIIFFVGGNWLVTLGVKSVPSGVAAILVATTPLWTALVETCWPHGERLNLRGWAGLLIGLAGVALLIKFDQPTDGEWTMGALLIIGSALAWAFGTVLLRRHRQHGSHLVGAAWQMVLGGTALCFAGLVVGEAAELAVAKFTPEGIYAFFHLLVFGSLVGFVAYNWLLGHVSTAHASTYAYVNPVVALLVGWLLGDHGISVAMVAGMCIILTAVALVRSQVGKKEPVEVQVRETVAHPSETGISSATSLAEPRA